MIVSPGTIEPGFLEERQDGSSFYGVSLLPGYNSSLNEMTGKNGRFETDLHGNVNILLGGAMIAGLIIAIILMCYCCHKNVRKYHPQEYSEYSEYWRAEPEVHSLEVFTTDTHGAYFDRRSSVSVNPEENCDTISCSGTIASAPGLPPAYESLLFDHRNLYPLCDKKSYPCSPVSIGQPVYSSLFDLSGNNVEGNLDEEGLPSYEAALKLDADGYV